MEKRLTISTVPIYIVYLSSHSGGTSVIGGQSVRLTRRGMALPLTHIAVTNSSASTLYSALQTIFLYTLFIYKKKHKYKIAKHFQDIAVPWTAPTALLQPTCVSVYNHKFWKNMSLVRENTLKVEFTLMWWTVLLLCNYVHVCLCNVEELEKRMAGPQGPQRSVANPPICPWILQRSSK